MSTRQVIVLLLILAVVVVFATGWADDKAPRGSGAGWRLSLDSELTPRAKSA
jgi:hypothetical protein